MEIIAMKKYKFCKANGCWWLVISDVEHLEAYKERTSSRYGHAIVNGITGEDTKYQRLYDAAELVASNNRTSVVAAMAMLADTMTYKQIEAIQKGKEVWFNEMGGWNNGIKDVTATVYRDKIIFPNYTKNDIRISKWGNGGQHFYAKVGEIEVKEVVNGETIMKWNTREEAYAKALAYCLE